MNKSEPCSSSLPRRVHSFASETRIRLPSLSGRKKQLTRQHSAKPSPQQGKGSNESLGRRAHLSKPSLPTSRLDSNQNKSNCALGPCVSGVFFWCVSMLFLVFYTASSGVEDKPNCLVAIKFCKVVASHTWPRILKCWQMRARLNR